MQVVLAIEIHAKFKQSQCIVPVELSKCRNCVEGGLLKRSCGLSGTAAVHPSKVKERRHANTLRDVPVIAFSIILLPRALCAYRHFAATRHVEHLSLMTG